MQNILVACQIGRWRLMEGTMKIVEADYICNGKERSQNKVFFLLHNHETDIILESRG